MDINAITAAIQKTELVKPACTVRAYGSRTVCVSECYSNICILAEGKCLFGNKIIFSWISLEAFRSKVMVKILLFCCASTVSPTTTEGPV